MLTLLHVSKISWQKKLTRLDGKVAEVRPLDDVVSVLLEVALPAVQGGLVDRALGGDVVVLDLLLHVELRLEDLWNLQQMLRIG